MIAILTQDTLFGVMLKSVLEEEGFEAVVSKTLPEKATGVLCDLDHGAAPDGLPAVTFSKNPFRSADLLRPFAIDTFAALCRSAFFAEACKVSKSKEVPTRKADDDPAYLLTEEGVCCFGESVMLTPTEHRLFAGLLEKRGQLVPSTALEALIGEEKGNSLAVYMNYLRKKLDYRFGRRLIATERGKGYRLL